MRHIDIIPAWILAFALGCAVPEIQALQAGPETPASQAAEKPSGGNRKPAGETAGEANRKDSKADEKSAGGEPGRGWHFSAWRTDGRVDYQAMFMRHADAGMPAMTEFEGNLMALELESTVTLNNGKRDLLDIAVQWPYYSQMKGVDGRGKEMHFFNAYGIFKLGLGKPNIRFGQFVAPFGNLPYYETHTRPLQSLFPQSLGFRINRGVSLEGMVGRYDYWVAGMGGSGDREVVGRIARRYDLPNGTLTAGISVLGGFNMPRFSVGLDPIMDDALEDMPLSHSLTFTDKTRFGVDAEYSMGMDLWRGELIAGRDGDGRVNGQFLQWSRALNEKNELAAQIARWEQPSGSRLRFGGWYGRKFGEYTTVRVWAERSLGTTLENGDSRNETRAGLQLIREFPDLSRWVRRLATHLGSHAAIQ